MPNLVEIGPVDQEKIFKFRQYIFISPWKGAWPFIWTNESPSPKDDLCQFGWNWPRVSGEEDKHVKSLQTDGRRTTGDQKSSQAFILGEIKKYNMASIPI